MSQTNFPSTLNSEDTIIYQNQQSQENDPIMQTLLARIARLRAEQEELYDSIYDDDTSDFEMEEIPPPYTPRLPYLEQIISYRQ